MVEAVVGASDGEEFDLTVEEGTREEGEGQEGREEGGAGGER